MRFTRAAAANGCQQEGRKIRKWLRNVTQTSTPGSSAWLAEIRILGRLLLLLGEPC
jgi:hypothetical protein